MAGQTPRQHDDNEAVALLYEVGTLCARVDNPFAICLDKLLDAAVRLSGSDGGLLQTLDPRTGPPDTLCCQQMFGDLDASALRREWESSAMAAALRQGGALCTRDLQSDASAVADDGTTVPWSQDFVRQMRAAGMRACVVHPLVAHADGLLGVLLTCSRAPLAVDGPPSRVLQLLVRQATDYLERKRAEALIQESEARFRAFTSATCDVVYSMNADWSVLLHLQSRELVRDSVTPNQGWFDQYIPREDQPAVRAAIDQAMASQGVFELEHRVQRIDGSIGWTHSRALPLLDAQGRVTEWFGTASDVTQRRLARDAVNLSEQRYSDLFNSIDQGYAVIRVELDPQDHPTDYVFLEVNPAFVQHTGLQDVVGRHARDCMAEPEQIWFDIFGRVALTGEPIRFEQYSRELGRHFDVFAFRLGLPEAREVAVLFNDISARRAHEQAQRLADRRKDEFLATLAHELRNPMAPIRTGLHILQMGRADAGKTGQVLASLQRQVDHMVRLVDDLLEVSRISRGKVELRRAPVDLASVLASAVETSTPQIDAMRHRLQLHLPRAPLRVDADAVRLSQVFANLLNNAAKYTDEGGEIVLAARAEGGQALVSVQDNGIGLAPEMLEDVFQMFVQAGQPGMRARGGLGIGLTLVRSLVELHGGSIHASSEGLGLGCTFTVSLPLLQDRPAQPAAGADGDAPQAPESRPRCVLVVDDNVDAAEGLRMLLETLGMQAHAVYSGASGLEAIAELRPELVFLDIGMPVMGGLEFARRIHTRFGSARPMLVAVTGWGRDEDLERSRQAGIDHHLVKPLELDDLMRILEPQPQAVPAP
ncbi:Signal transduction histidine kinase [Oryzisolibacter propanilivorax]|uniref:histidine kinase n=1 Tax=Oryzisolibacter propanilivorax TaxID=1527607 RepID=A0A1G9U896_9BURK|nr:ATP-binding protein [Oryzisolibacter propanilivorax]SDM56042.1 Signal transduction histidine kinase [Oryzisolibacter propanilivorax]